MSDTSEQNDGKTAQLIKQILVDWLVEKKAQAAEAANGGNSNFSTADDSAVGVQLESLLPSDSALVIQITCNGLNLDLKLDLWQWNGWFGRLSRRDKRGRSSRYGEWSTIRKFQWWQQWYSYNH